MFREDDDDARHTLFICRQFKNKREELYEEVEAIILENERKWKAVELYINYIMGEKNAEERRRQKI